MNAKKFFIIAMIVNAVGVGGVGSGEDVATIGIITIDVNTDIT